MEPSDRVLVAGLVVAGIGATIGAGCMSYISVTEVWPRLGPMGAWLVSPHIDAIPPAFEAPLNRARELVSNAH